MEAASEALTDATSATGPILLPRVLGDSSVAVLLVDQTSGEVTYANVAALELAGNVTLPIPIDQWSAKAGVTDIDGGPLAGTSEPLSLLAAGELVAGEPVRVRGTAAVSATDRGTDDARGPVVWVTGFPLDGGDGDPMSLLVFLPVEQPTGGTDSEQVLRALRERAVLATDMCFTMSDPRQPGNPLIWVNPAFTRVTGYAAEDAIGRNCKFLQGPATDPAAVAEMVADLTAGRSTTVTLLNYRPNGTAFWNSVAISPVLDGAGELVSFVGIQTDVTERVAADVQRDAAHAAEQQARRTAEDARARMALLVEATTSLGASLDVAALQERLGHLYVPRLADWVTIAQTGGGGVVTAVFSHHRAGPAARGSLDEVEAHYLGKPFPEGGPSAQAVATGSPVALAGLTGEKTRLFSRSLHGTGTLDALGTGSLLAIPLTSRRGAWGVLTLIRESPEPFSDDDLHIAHDLGRRVGQALDNARLYTAEASVAETLQHALLPELPDIAGVQAAAHYIAASAAAAVGGDFYDLLPLPGGTVGIAIGDVAGHDITAAAAMGQLRGLIRSEAWAADATAPHTVLTRVDRLLDVLHMPVLATAALLRATPPGHDQNPTEHWSVEWSNAGHPPVLLRRPDGEVGLLGEDHDVLLGTGMAGLLRPRAGTTHEVPAGSQLLLYTDGLIEQPTPGDPGPARDLDAGLNRLQTMWSTLSHGLDPTATCRALGQLVVERSDDVAVLVVQLETATKVAAARSGPDVASAGTVPT